MQGQTLWHGLAIALHYASQLSIGKTIKALLAGSADVMAEETDDYFILRT